MPSIPRPVRLLGWSSLFTDAATEMIYPLLPVYLSRVLGAGAFSLGVIEGVAEAVNSLLKVLSGYVSDRWTRRRPIVIAGYLLSSAARPFIALTGTWLQVLFVRALDRTGKGIRGAPRDAMLARFASPADRGRVFGFHRAMDHAGAIVGPLIASALLLLAPGEYRLVFALTIVPGTVAVALLFLVPEPETPGARPPYGGRVPRGAASETSSGPAEEARGPAGTMPRQLWTFLAIVLLFSLGNSADAFLLLRVSEAVGSATYIPVLWSAFHVVKASLSTWGGTLSDRLGRKQVIVIGWLVYAVVYLGFAASDDAGALVGWFLIYGVYFALTEGAEKALIADLTPPDRHGAAFGFYNAALGVGTLAASVTFGFLYERFGAAVAFGAGASLAAAAAIALMFARVGASRGAMMVGSNVPNSDHQ
ncbi:MAG: MFS transporter [Acidobacteria bacterium]|nr:MFS transporter [Acidobacteriota bacterium]